MSRRIPQTFINEIIARADLLEVIGARVRLTKSGSNYKGLCPFHDEKTPSFTVSTEKGFFKCFGCGAYGNAIDFVMRYENRSFPETIEILADMLRLEVPVEKDEERHEHLDLLYTVLREADQLYRGTLRESEPAIDYLRRRGIDGPTAARFALGYAPDAWDTCRKALGGNEERDGLLIEAGLLRRNDQGRIYDRFRDRIMFPIRDSRGRVVGFGGRVLGDGEPKYLNSPDTPLFDKSRTLYGLYEAREQPGRPEVVVVVEGYLDVIALAQHGLGPSIATMGTATTADNVRQLTRLAERVVFCFDGDRAGRDAAWRALESVLPYGGGSVALEFLLLPEGEDPDSFVRGRGPEAFAEALGRALPLSRFLVDQARADLDLGSADGRSRLITTVKPLVERLPGGVYRELLIDELAGTVGMRAERLEAALGSRSETPPARAPRASDTANRTVMRKAITLVVHYPAAAAAVGEIEGLADVDVPGAELLRRLLEFAARDPDVKCAELVEAFRADDEGRFLKRLAAEEPLDNAEAAPDVLRDSLERIVARHRRHAAVDALRRRAGPRPEP